MCISYTGVILMFRGDSFKTGVMLKDCSDVSLTGVMLTWCAWDNSIFEKYYIHLGDILDILVLINSSINFVLYCTMSQAYR